jgi:alkaline phosphatase
MRGAMKLFPILFLLTIAGGSSNAADVPQSAQQWFDAGKASAQHNKQQRPNTKKAKNVILFIGDGMGISTVTAARILEGQQRGVDGEYNRLSFERFPYSAFSVTASANQQTSDSAPTATALVSGVKANDGAIWWTKPFGAKNPMPKLPQRKVW